MLRTLKLVLLLTIVPLYTANAQFTEWSGDYHPAGIDAGVSTVHVHGDLLITTGGFGFAGPNWITDIAVYNLTEFRWATEHPLFGLEANVRDFLFMTSGDIVAAGGLESITGVPGSSVAQYSGGTWHSLGSGFDDPVQSLVEYKDSICAGGDFEKNGGNNTPYVACWTGTEWEALGGGIEEPNGANVYAMLAVGDSLFVGGDILAVGGHSVEGVAYWNGSEWNAMAGGLSDDNANRDGVVLGLYFDELEQQVIVGGRFDFAGEIDAQNIAAWKDGTWHALFEGVDDTITSIQRSGNTLYASGQRFFMADADGWNELNMPPKRFLSDIIATDHGLVVGMTTLIAPGAGRNASQFLFMLDESAQELRPFVPGNGIDGYLNAVLNDGDGGFYVAGEFWHAGVTPALSVAHWDGQDWSAIGSGVNGFVRDLELDDEGTLYATGYFTIAGGEPASGVARWDGTDWDNLGTGLEFNLANSSDGGYALEYVSGKIYVGGQFQSLGSEPTDRPYLARWDVASEAWDDFDAGSNGTVLDLDVTDSDELLIGGLFQAIGTVDQAKGVVLYHGGTDTWSRLGDGSGVPVRSVFVDADGALLATGEFENGRTVGRYDGSQWLGVGSASLDNGDVFEICQPQGGPLFVVGLLTAPPFGWPSSSRIAYLDENDNWTAEKTGSISGTNDPAVWTCEAMGPDLLIGGEFDGIDNSLLFSEERKSTSGIARLIRAVSIDTEALVDPSSLSASEGATVYPNPVRGNRFTIRTSDVVSGVIDIRLYNALGRLVFSRKVDLQNQTEIVVHLNRDGLAQGIYFVRVSDADPAIPIMLLR